MVISENFDDVPLDDPEVDIEKPKAPVPPAKSPQEIEDQTDELLRSIERSGRGTYALRAGEDAEEFDPSAIHPEDLVDPDEFADSGIVHGDGVDELAEGFDVIEPVSKSERRAQRVREQELLEEKSRRHRRMLRGILIFAIVILLVIVGVVCVFVWRNSITPDVKQADTEALVISKAGTNKAEFQAVDAKKVPQLMKAYGKKLTKVGEAFKGSLVMSSDKPKKASDPRVKSMRKIANATVVSDGKTIADVAFGLNKKNKVVYIYASYDMDALQVADAPFEQLIHDETVASSLLKAMGVPNSGVAAGPLTVDKLPNAVTSNDKSGKEVAVFTGKTGAGYEPTVWKLTETYDHTAAGSSEDGAVLRTMLCELC